MTIRHVPHTEVSGANEHMQVVLDGTKVHWDTTGSGPRSGERIAPITIDMALRRTRNHGCVFCYAMLQENERQPITIEVPQT
jgi:hypothetical protein